MNKATDGNKFISRSDSSDDDSSSSETSSSHSSDYRDENDEEDDETDASNPATKIYSLFGGDKQFDNVQELFRYENDQHKFNLLDVLARYEMDMIGYIKMINFIRSEVISR